MKFAPKSALRASSARLWLAAAPVCLLLTACDPMEAPPPREKFKASLPVPRRTANPEPENEQWLAAWRDLRSRVGDMQERLAEVQKLHTEYQFDGFLRLDPATLGKDQLCSLFHFLDKDYFTIERRILIELLQRRTKRAESGATTPVRKKHYRDRLAAAMQRDELRMVDLETAIGQYAAPGEGDFRIPNSLTEAEELELRARVTEMLDKTRTAVAEMDRQIDALKVEVFGEDAVRKPEPSGEDPETDTALAGVGADQGDAAPGVAGTPAEPEAPFTILWPVPAASTALAAEAQAQEQAMEQEQEPAADAGSPAVEGSEQGEPVVTDGPDGETGPQSILLPAPAPEGSEEFPQQNDPPQNDGSGAGFAEQDAAFDR